MKFLKPFFTSTFSLFTIFTYAQESERYTKKMILPSAAKSSTETEL